MSTYQNVDIGGLEAKRWEIQNENTALEVKTQSGKALQTSDEPQQCAQHNNGQSKSAGHQEVGSTQYLQIIPIKMNLRQINSIKMEIRMEMNLILKKKLQQTAMKVIMLKPNNLIG